MLRIDRLFCLLSVLLIIPVAFYGQPAGEIIDYTTVVKIEKDRLITEQAFLIQVNHKQGDWISNIQIPYNKNLKLEILEASIINSEGIQVRSLKKNEIVTRSLFSNQSFFTDNLVQEFRLKWDEYPYRIKYRYRETVENYLYVTSWDPSYRNAHVHSASLRVELPPGFKSNIDVSGALSYEVDTLEKSIVHLWKVSGIPPVKEELFLPPLRELLPYVKVVPVNFMYGHPGSFDSWVSFGKWVDDMNHNLDDLPQYEKDKVGALINNLTNTADIIKTLYHYLQDNTRYINVSIDIGGMKPYPASYVAHNKYGDCKALTIYMKALLKHAGIPSFYTVIHAGENPVDINPNLPSQQFNHVILCVPVAGDTIWLDNASNLIPSNYVGTFNQNRYALLVNSGESRLVRTPAMSPEDVMEKRVYSFNLDEQGSGSLLLSKTLKGDKFEFYRYIQHNLTEKDQKPEIEKEAGLMNSVLNTWQYDYPDRNVPQLELRLELDVKNQIRNLGGSMVILPVPLKTFNPEKPETRVNPVKISYPVNRCDTILYNLPFIGQYKISLPENISLDTEYGNYSEEFSRDNGQIIIVRNFLLYAGKYSTEEYTGFYSFLDSIKNQRQKSVIVLNP